MGNVALRSGTKLDYDPRRMKVTNVPDANRYIKPVYREGQSLPEA
jgi:hypothetical protein